MTAPERLLATARAEIGYLEKATNAHLEDKTANAGSANFTKYAAYLDTLGIYNFPKNGYAWCDMFVDWCFVTAFGLATAMAMTNQPMGGYGAGCTGSANYYKQVGQFFTADPQPGDQIFFSNDGGKNMVHTGIVEKVGSGRVWTIEGNTSSASGVVPNGGAVRDKCYYLTNNRIAGYGRPDWSLVEEEFDMPFTYEQFKEFMGQYREELRDNDSSEYSAEARQWSVDSGLITGNGTEVDGQPNYMWEDTLTREQLVTVLYRFAKLMGKV